MKRALFLFFLLLPASVSYAAPIEKASQKEVQLPTGPATGKLTVTVSAAEMSVAESLTLTIAVEEPKGTAARLPSFDELGFATDFTERSQRFRVTDISPVSETMLADGGRQLKQTYVVEPWLSGDYALLPIMVSFYQNDSSEKTASKSEFQWPMPLFSLMTDGIRVTVSPLPPDRRELSDLLGQADLKAENLLPKERRTENKSDEELKRQEEDKKEAAMALHERRFPWWIVWILLGMIVLAPLVWYLGRTKLKEYFAAKTIPPHIKALQDFDRLIQKDLLKKGLVKEFYYELSFILRTYIGGRYNLFADRQTTEEFFQQLLSDNPFDAMSEQILRDFSDLADTVKYSLYRPQTDLALKSLHIARSFVESTKPHEEESK
jgi:hypothetical protein